MPSGINYKKNTRDLLHIVSSTLSAFFYPHVQRGIASSLNDESLFFCGQIAGFALLLIRIFYNKTIVMFIDLPLFQIPEKLTHIPDTSDEEPEGGKHSQYAGNGKQRHKEVGAPGFEFPTGDEVPDHRTEEGDSATPHHAVTENKPGDDLVSGGVFLIDTDKFMDPGDLFRFCF